MLCPYIIIVVYRVLTMAQVPLGLVDAKLSYILWPLHRAGPLTPPEKPVSKVGVPRDFRWRDTMAAFERERKRQARVTPATKNDDTVVS